MRFIQKILIIFLFTLSAQASAQESGAFKAVQGMFAAMSAYDYDGIAAFGTDQYHLLEHGEIWTMDDLINAMKSDEGMVERRNYFSVIEEKTYGDTVWISYWNRGDLTTSEGKEISLVWLESAVVIKKDDKWLVEMLHSTRVHKPQTIPEDVVMTEFVGENPFMIKE